MRTVTVNKNQLIEILKKNRDLHVKKYLEACESYKLDALEEIEATFESLREFVTTLKKGQTAHVAYPPFRVQYPISYEDSYTDAIGMLTMHVDETIELDSHEYQKYCKDDWEWKDSFTRTVGSYKNKV